MTHAHVIEASRGDSFELGIVTLRLLIGTDQTSGAWAMALFTTGRCPSPNSPRMGRNSPKGLWKSPSRPRSLN